MAMERLQAASKRTGSSPTAWHAIIVASWTMSGVRLCRVHLSERSIVEDLHELGVSLIQRRQVIRKQYVVIF